MRELFAPALWRDVLGLQCESLALGSLFNATLIFLISAAC